MLRPKFIVPSLVILTALIVITAFTSPLDKTLGDRVRMVYVHGAIIRVVMAILVIAGGLGLAYLVTRRATVFDWANAAFEGGLALWFVYLGTSVVTTLQAWGGIAWFEPRWLVTLQMTGLLPIVLIVGLIVKHSPISAALFAIVPIVMMLLLAQARLVLHPLDPIGTSGSSTIQLAYGVMLSWWVLVGVQVVRGMHAWALTRAAAHL
ncbi:MAG: hypothetical protein HY870_13030 [Chloroflexi bacterium]|nr:hypothetical protein [Chloroflexota bacterium]